MPANNTEMIKIWTIAHLHLKNVSEAYKARGETSRSMTLLASEVILSIPFPNGEETKPATEQVKEE